MNPATPIANETNLYYVGVSCDRMSTIRFFISGQLLQPFSVKKQKDSKSENGVSLNNRMKLMTPTQQAVEKAKVEHAIKRKRWRKNHYPEGAWWEEDKKT